MGMIPLQKTVLASAVLPVLRLVAPVNKPLMIIRFNQRKVYFEQQMYNAVARAVSAKPSVVFDIISYIPQSRDHEKNMRVMTKASKHLKSITDSLVKMGVPATRFSVSTKLTPGISYDEIHIFVR